MSEVWQAALRSARHSASPWPCRLVCRLALPWPLPLLCRLVCHLALPWPCRWALLLPCWLVCRSALPWPCLLM